VSLWDDIASWFSGGQPFQSGNPTLDQMVTLAHGDPSDRAPDYYTQPPPPLGQSLMDLSSMVAPYIAGGAPSGSMSSGMRVPGLVSDAASELPKPNLSQGSAAPLFDYGLISSDVPKDVPQVDLVRKPPPPKGIPDWVQQVSDPANLARVQDATAKGVEMGGANWYDPAPLRQAWGEVLGDEGDAALRQYLNSVAGTSNLSKVPENIRNASYYYGLLREGAPAPTETPPPPYGHIAQQQHLANMQGIWDTGGINSMQNPKPASFVENLLGNYQPYTFDTWMSRLYGLKNRQGNPVTSPDQAHYGYLEQLGQDQAAQMGLSPAQAQAAGWVTQVNPKEIVPFAQQLEDRIRLTADKLGMDPRTVRNQMIAGKLPLLSALPVGLLGSQLIPDQTAAPVQ
jgi:hypothetical protein